MSSKDCLQEPQVIKLYCESHRNAVCVGGYGHFGCRPDQKREDYIKYDLQAHQYVGSDRKIVKVGETYCGRKIPSRSWKGKQYYENHIWNRSGLGHPGLVDGNLIVEAKGGLPSTNKVRTLLGQLSSYVELEPSFKAGFLFPKFWLEAKSLQTEFKVFEKHGILLPTI